MGSDRKRIKASAQGFEGSYEELRMKWACYQQHLPPPTPAPGLCEGSGKTVETSGAPADLPDGHWIGNMSSTKSHLHLDQPGPWPVLPE